MSGALWAVVAGVGFGVFQSLNRRAVSGMDVYLATFLQLLVSALVLAAISLLTVDVSLVSRAPMEALISFALAGFIHFFIGWTFLNISQQRIGAARTSPLIGTTPLFAAVIAAVTLRESLNAVSLLGIVLIVAGVYVVSNRSGPSSATGVVAHGPVAGANLWRASLFGLSAALCWAISPIFTRQGLEGLSSPLLGVTIGMTASAAAYGLPLMVRRKQQGALPASTDALLFKIAAGVLVGLSTWARWVALDLAPVAPVLALTLVSVPVVILLSPIVSGKHQEPVTVALWAGAALIVGGALMLISFG
ncbi:MAG TPA: EamA family transporter [Anaerolineae bacterium]|nr:EamA family transporter [Anaerolineae bacterium]